MYLLNGGVSSELKIAHVTPLFKSWEPNKFSK